jgi:hypothetical protein
LPAVLAATSTATVAAAGALVPPSSSRASARTVYVPGSANGGVS